METNGNGGRDQHDGRERYTLIRDMRPEERPRERLRDYGAATLSNADLIAILLRTGSSKESAVAQAHRLLRDLGGLRNIATAPFEELRRQHGLGEAKAAQIQAALVLGMRAASENAETRRRVTSPEDVAELMLHEMSEFTQEHVRVIMLDNRNRLLGIANVYKGSIHTVQIRYAELFRDAIRSDAAGVVVVHNHPSQDPMPSAADIDMTKGLVQVGKLLDITVNDHIIIGGGSYVSLKTMRLGFGDA